MKNCTYLICIDTCKHPCYHHPEDNKPIQYLPKFPCVPFVCVCVAAKGVCLW